MLCPTNPTLAERKLSAPAIVADAVARRARRRITLRLLPYVLLLYVIAYLDRNNLATAALQMPHDLGFNDRVIGFGAGIFALGYVILEIPGTLIIERWSARRWITRIMISWGVVTIGMAFIRTPHQFYTMRFLLGLAEAGFFPGIIVYLTHWFVYEDRAKAIAGFMAAIPLAYVVGSPIRQSRSPNNSENYPLYATRLPRKFSHCDNCYSRGFLGREEPRYKGYVIEARSCELKDGDSWRTFPSRSMMGPA